MRSMTGYGQARWQKGGRTLLVEIRGVNQRFLEIKMNMPREFLAWESELRALVQESVARGKVDVAVTQTGSNANDWTVEVNLALAKEYVRAWRKLQKEFRLPDAQAAEFLPHREILRVVERRNETVVGLATLKKTLASALQRFSRERDRVTTLLEGKQVSEDRLLQEMALAAERSDVTEELVRLESHLQAVRELVRGKEPAGKKLDFLLQETHREVNTIASKSADLAVTNLSVDARAEIEKLREQVQNVE